MTAARLISVGLMIAAAIWSAVLLRRSPDWRSALLVALVAVLAVVDVVQPPAGDGPMLLTSVVVLAAVALLHRSAVERGRATARHALEHAYLEQLFENAPEAIVLVDSDSRILRANAYFGTLFGYGEDEALGRSVDELLAGPDRRAEALELTRRVAAGERTSIETVRYRRDGTPVDVSIIGMPISVNGDQVGVYAIYRDITGRKQAEAAVRQSEEKYRTILASIEDGYYEVDLAGTFTFCNDALCRILGHPRERVIGTNHREYADEVTAGRVYRIFNRAFSGAGSTWFDWDVVRPDGTRRSVEGSITLIKDASGQGLGFRGILRDVSERKDTESALRESEERYARATRGANDGLWDWNLEQDTVYYSGRWKGMLGYEDDELCNEPDVWFSRVHPDDLERLRADIATHVNGASPHFENEHRIRHKDGVYRWVLCRGVAERDTRGRATRMAGSQTDISDRKLAEEQLVHDAFHDMLTGLPNRALFMNLLERSLGRLRRRNDYRFAVLFLDIDRFKIVNDSLGHMLGDQLLVAVARRLAACLRPGDTVARLGGDEFTILLDDITGEPDAARVAERIQAELATPFTLHHHEVFTAASIGIALSGPAYRRPEEVLRDADTAMYRAKSRGRARHEVFDTDMHQHAVTLLKLETDLRRALDRGEFRVYYQPIVSLPSGELAGFEALLRWAHPERGVVCPADFIHLAEETGLIIPIGEWVLWEACRQAQEWHATGAMAGRPITVSVNLSARQFGQFAIVDSVSDALAASGLPPSHLKLEITESVLMDHAEASVRVLGELKRSGVQVQVDDFGTGYSSLSYLHRFKLDALKIDRSFISRLGTDAENTEIVRTIVTLARNLGMSLVAEGVETEAQRRYLESLACEQVQGFLFSGPLEAAAAESLLAAPGAWLKPLSLAPSLEP